MKTFAYIPVVPGRIKEIYIGEELFPMHPDLAKHWRVVPGGTEINDFYDGKTFKSNEKTLADVKVERISVLAHAYEINLAGYFISNALGTSYQYASGPLALATLNALIAIGNAADYVYSDENDTTTIANHTLAQLEKVREDLLNKREVALSNYKAKIAAVDAATTIEEVNNISY